MMDIKFWTGVCLLLVAIVGGLWLVREDKRRKSLYTPKASMSFREGLNLTGFPLVTFTNNNKVFAFLLDTGSNVSLINESALESMSYEEDESEIDLYGLDGIERTGKIIISYLTYESVSYKAHFVVTDLTPTFSQIKREHGVMLHGILGSDFFKAYEYILDFDKLIAYSKLAEKK